MAEQEHIDPVYRYVDEQVTNLKNDILFNELLPLQDHIHILERIIVEQRMMVIWVRVTSAILAMLHNIDDRDQRETLQKAHRILLEQVQWFYGAMREPSN